MSRSARRIATLVLVLCGPCAWGGTLDLDFFSNGDSTYYEFFSAGFYRMDLYSPPPFHMNQSLREIGNPSNIYNQAFDGFPNDEDFRFGSLTYDETTLVGGTGVADITALSLGILTDPDDPGHINSARWAAGTTTFVDTFSGTVTFSDGDVISVDLGSVIRLEVINVGGSTIPGTYDGTFQMSGLAFALSVTGAPEIDVFGTLPPQPFPLEWDFSGTLVLPTGPNGDFNNDGNYDCLDIDSLVVDIAVRANTPGFDLTGDGFVNGDDLTAWLSEAGGINLGPGRSYLPGDGDLSGAVDGSDFGIWNASKFTNTAAWCQGDFNADGAIDGSDFGIWNGHKFTASDSMSAVPEPVMPWSSIWILTVIGRMLWRDVR